MDSAIKLSYLLFDLQLYTLSFFVISLPHPFKGTSIMENQFPIIEHDEVSLFWEIG